MPYPLKYTLIIIMILAQIGVFVFLFIDRTVSLWLISVFAISLGIILLDLGREAKKNK